VVPVLHGTLQFLPDAVADVGCGQEGSVHKRLADLEI
jgi:hypothetical protein